MPKRRKTAVSAPKVKLRIPLPRQTGGRHEDKTRRPWRQRKHRKTAEDKE